MANLRFVEARMEVFRRFRDFFDFLGLQPLVIIKDNLIPLGLDLTEDIKGRGYRFCDVLEIDRRRLKIFMNNCESSTVFAYAHFGQVYDKITGKIKNVDTDEVIYMRLEEITDVHKRVWFDKQWCMVDKKMEYLEWLKKHG
jgi:hypothetical protein